MSVFWKGFLVTSSPIIGILITGIISDFSEVLDMSVYVFGFYLIVFFGLAFPALIFSEKIYPRYIKKFDEVYKKQWNSNKFLVVLTFLISYLIITLSYENCNWNPMYDGCMGLTEAILTTTENQVHSNNQVLTTIGVGSGLIISSTIILKELIPRGVFYWKRRE